tara:strand:- start:224 stop:637 length:414 start_codon:yes stop_codon:yes gene_type:complete
MSSTDLPLFVKGIFEKEINNIKINLIKHIAKDYSLNEEELIKKYTCDIEIINKKIENIQITKKNNYNSNLNKEDRCLARVYNNGKGAQCKRSKKHDDLCTLHYNILIKEDKLKYGLITEPKPNNVFHYKNPKREKIY